MKYFKEKYHPILKNQMNSASIDPVFLLKFLDQAFRLKWRKQVFLNWI